MINLIEEYFNAFNNEQYESMISLLHPQVEHEINEGSVQVGIEKFRNFLKHMEISYKEKLEEIVIMNSKNPNRFSAEFFVAGVYLKTDPGLPEAIGQKYRIRAGSFFEVKENKINRVTTYYNLNNWIEVIKNQS
jgi:steroid delta-isomerase-like uncharacterized protein